MEILSETEKNIKKTNISTQPEKCSFSGATADFYVGLSGTANSDSKVCIYELTIHMCLFMRFHFFDINVFKSYSCSLTDILSVWIYFQEISTVWISCI